MLHTKTQNKPLFSLKLTESIDNANDLRTLGLWPPILDLMKSAPEPDIRSFAAWVSGTAVQNNPKSQKDVCVYGLYSQFLIKL